MHRNFGHVVVVATLLFLAQLGVAQTTLYWDVNGNPAGTGGTGTWDTTNARWSTNVNGGSNVVWNNAAPTDYAIFGGTAGTVTWSTNISVRRITFTTTGYTLARSAGTFTLDTDGWIDTQANTATITGPIAGAVGLTKLGTGTLILSGTNTYTGVTNISLAVLNIQNAAALGSATAGNGTTVAGTGAALEIQGGIAVGAEALTLNGTGVSSGGALRSISGTNSYAGAITLGSASRINSDAGTLTLTGGVTGTFQLTVGGAGDTTVSTTGINNGALLVKDGAGTLTVGASSNFTKLQLSGGTYSTNMAAGTLGATPGAFMADNMIFDGGRLLATATGSFSTNRGATLNTNTSSNMSAATGVTLTYGAVMTGAGNITFGGGAANGIVILSGANTYTGSTTVDNGTLRAGASNTVFGNGSAVTVNTTTAGSTALLDLNNFNVTIGSLTFGGANATATSTNNVQTGTGTLTLGGNVTYDATNNPLGATLSGKLALGANRVFNIGDSSNAADDLTVSAAISGTLFGINKQGAGTLKLSGLNSYTGVTTVSGGVLSVGNIAAGNNLGSATSAAANLVLNGGTLRYTGAAASSNRLFTLGTAGGTIESTTNTLTLNGVGSVAFSGTGARTLTLGGASNGSHTAVLGDADGSSATSLVKADAGTWTLAGANTFTGGTSITAGTLNLTNALALQNSTLNYAAAGGAVTFTGFTAATLGGLSGDKALALTNAAAAALALSVGNNNASTTYSGILSGAGSLIKVGAGTTTLSGANSYTGTTTVNNGTLRAGASTTAFGNGSAVTVNATTAGTTATLDLNGFNVAIGGLTFGGATGTSTSTNAVQTGAGTLTLGGNVTYDATNNPLGATLSGNLALGASRVFTIGDSSNAANDLTVSAVISGASFGLDKQGAGTLRLDGTNTFSGDTTITAGSLNLTNSLALQNSTLNYAAAGGTVAFTGITAATLGGLSGDKALALTNAAATAVALSVGNNNTSTTYSGILSGTGSLTKVGSGTLALSSANTFSGDTAINTGTLNLTNSLALQNSTLNYAAAGGTVTFTGISAATLGGLSGDKALALTNAAAAALALSVGNNNASTTYSGNLSGAGSLSKVGSGTTTLSGANSYTGTTTVNNGTLRAGASTTAFGNGSAVTVNATTAGTTATLDLNGYDVTIGSLTFGGATGTSTSTNVVQTGAGTLTLGGNVTYDATGNPLGSTLSGNLALGATRVFTIGDSSSATDDLTVSAITSGIGFGITKQGGGTLKLSGANSYTGATAVNEGTLRAGASTTVFGNGSAVTVNASTAGTTATLDLNGYDVTIGSLTFGGATGTSTSTNAVQTGAGTLTLGGNVTYDATNNPLGATLSGNLALGASRVFTIGDSSNAANDLTVSAVISGASFGLDKQGAGTLRLDGANTFSGDTTITAGSLNLTNSLALQNSTLNYAATGNNVTFTGITAATLGGLSGDKALALTNAAAAALALTVGNNDANTTYSGILSGAGSLTKTGGGTLTLTGPNTYTGATTVSAGVLNIQNASALGGTASGATVSAGAALELQGGIAVGTEALTLNGGGISSGGALRSVSGANSSAGAIALNSASRINADAGSTLTLTGGVTGTGLELTVGGAGNTVFNSFGINTSTGGSLVKDGSGTLTLNASGNYTGETTINAGTLKITTSNALGSGGLTLSPSSPSGSATFDFAHNNATGVFASLTFGGAANSTSSIINTAGNPNSRFALGGTLIYDATSNPGTASIQSKLDLNGGTRTFQIGDSSNTSSEVSISGAIQNGNIVKTGAGTLEFSAANTFTDLSVNSGTVRATSSASALGAGALTLAGGVLELANNTGLNFGRATTVTSSSTIISDRGAPAGAGVTHTLGTLSMGAQTLTIAKGDYVNTGTAGLTFGATTLSASGGTFAPGAGTLLTFGNVTGTNTGFSVNGAGDATIGGVIATGAGTLTKAGSGTLLLSGGSANTFTGLTTVDGGILALGKSANVIALAGNLLINDGAVRLNATGQIASTSSVTFGNAGGTPILNLNGFSQTLGSIATTNGAAQIQLGSGTSTFTVGDATNTTYAGTFTGGASAAIVKQGSGTLTLSGNSTNTGTVAINAGTVIIQNNGALGATGGAGTTVANNATLQLQGGLTAAGNGTLSLTGTGTGSGALVNVSGDNLWGGNITLAGNTTVNGGGSLSDTLRLGTASTLYDRFYDPAGPPTDANTLALGSNTLTVSGTGTTQINSRITGTGNLVVDVATGSVARLSANMNTYTGTTTVNNGILEVRTTLNTFPGDLDNPNFFGINGPLVIGNGVGLPGTAVVDLVSGTIGDEVINFTTPVTLYSDGKVLVQSAQSIDSLTFNGGSVDTGANGTLFLNNTVTVNASAGNTATITGGGALSLTVHNGSPNATRIFNVVGGVGNVSDLTISSVISLGSIVKNGAGTMTITSDNSNGYEGTTLINNGILNIQNGKALGLGSGSNTNATTVAGDGVTNGTLQVQGGITVSNEKLFLNSDGFDHNGALQSVSGNNQWSGAISLGSAARINSNKAGDTLTLAGTTSAPAATNYLLTFGGVGNTTVTGAINTINGGVTKDGSGTLTLAGNNGYAGLTDITAGTVIVRHNNGLGSLAAGTTVASGAELQLSKISSDLTIGAEALTLNGSGLSNGGTGALHNVSGNNTYQGAITLGSNATIKADASSSLTLTGGISGAGKALTVGGAGSITTTGAITTGSVTTGLDVHGNNVITATGSTGTLTKIDAGTFTFGGGVTSKLDGITLSAGGIAVTGSNTLVQTGPLSAAVSTTLTIDSSNTVQAFYGSGNTTFSGAMAGAGTFEKEGGGILTFDHSFAATSLTLVLNGGTLALASGANIEVGTIHITGNTVLDFGLSTATVLKSATLIIDQGVTVTVNNWVSLSDAWYVTTAFYQPGAPNLNAVLDANNSAPENQIVFAGFTASWTGWVTPQGGQYFDHELRPIPEPSTYGLIFFASTLGLLGARRFWRKRHNSGSNQA